jgi:hypothetical protein
MDYCKEIHIGQKKKKYSVEEKTANKEKLKKLQEEDSKVVTGVFKNHEVPGGDLEFAIRLYPNEPVRKYYLEDGKSYDLPLGVAKHINRMCKYTKSKYLVDKDGKKIIGADKPIDRYSFVAGDFM